VGTFREGLAERTNLRRAAITACVVGPILTAINQTPVLSALSRGEPVASIAFVRIALTFVVPFVVSLTSAAMSGAGRTSR
jgi:hypothetical protein